MRWSPKWLTRSATFSATFLTKYQEMESSIGLFLTTTDQFEISQVLCSIGVEETLNHQRHKILVLPNKMFIAFFSIKATPIHTWTCHQTYLSYVGAEGLERRLRLEMKKYICLTKGHFPTSNQLWSTNRWVIHGHPGSLKVILGLLPEDSSSFLFLSSFLIVAGTWWRTIVFH